MHMEAQVMMILSGTFIGFLPRHIADGWVAKGRMRALRPERYHFASQHFLAYRSGDAERPLVQSFARAIRNVPDLAN